MNSKTLSLYLQLVELSLALAHTHVGSALVASNSACTAVPALVDIHKVHGSSSCSCHGEVSSNGRRDGVCVLW
jgi:hypothetical protein